MDGSVAALRQALMAIGRSDAVDVIDRFLKEEGSATTSVAQGRSVPGEIHVLFSFDIFQLHIASLYVVSLFLLPLPLSLSSVWERSPPGYGRFWYQWHIGLDPGLHDK